MHLYKPQGLQKQGLTYDKGANQITRSSKYNINSVNTCLKKRQVYKIDKRKCSNITSHKKRCHLEKLP